MKTKRVSGCRRHTSSAASRRWMYPLYRSLRPMYRTRGASGGIPCAARNASPSRERTAFGPMPVVTIRASSTPSFANHPFSQSVIVVIASARLYRAKSLGVSPPWNCPRWASGVSTIGVPSVSPTSRELSRYSRPMLWIRSRSSAYHSSTSVRMRSTSVEASATTPRKPPRGFTCTTSTPSLMKTRRSSNACPQTTRTSWPRAASRVANWYARLSDPPTRAYARFVKRSFIVAPSEASRVLGRDGAFVQTDELRPRSFPRAHIGGVQVLRRRRRSYGQPEQRHPRLRERAPALSVIAGLAGGHDVFPNVLTAPVTRDHVVERQVVATPAAVLAGVVVADQDFLARHLHDRPRTLHVVGETDDRRRRKGEPLACDEVPVRLYHARLLLGKEDHRA